MNWSVGGALKDLIGTAAGEARRLPGMAGGYIKRHPRPFMGAGVGAAGVGGYAGYRRYRSSGRNGLQGRSSGGMTGY